MVNEGEVVVGLLLMVIGFFLLFTLIFFIVGLVMGFIGFIIFIVGLATSSPQPQTVFFSPPPIYQPTYVPQPQTIIVPSPPAYQPPAIYYPQTPPPPPPAPSTGGVARVFVRCRQCQGVFEQSIGRCPSCGASV